MSEEIPPRRIVLRGALALACGACLPAVLAGCDAKKGANSGASAPGAAPAGTTGSASSAAPAAPAASGKVAKASVNYQSEPKGGLQCKDCTHFIAESNTCKQVEGPISPDGWCQLWAKKV